MTTSHHIVCQIVKMIIIGVFLLGCSEPKPTPSPNQIDKSPFTGIPCAAPCWQGLLIGTSNENDVMSTLSTLTFINQDTIQIFRGGTMPSIDPVVFARGVEIRANCIYPEKQCLILRVADDVLTEIDTMLNYEIKVDEAIGLLGNPDRIGYGMLGAERVICEVFLVWSDKHLVLASEKFEGPEAAEKNCNVIRDTGKVTSSLLISEARYMSTKAIEFMLSRGYNFTVDYSGTIP